MLKLKTATMIGAFLLGGLALGQAQLKLPNAGSGLGMSGFMTNPNPDSGNGGFSLTGGDRDAMIDLVAKVIVARVDRNGDGTISEGEIAAAIKETLERVEEELAKRFEEADTNGDGDLDFEEFSAISAVQSVAGRDPDKPAEIFKKIDANEDERVSKEELRALMQNASSGASVPDSGAGSP